MVVPRQIAVSYASAQENAAASSGTVERFRSELEAAGVTVTIASKDLHPGDSINKFMAEKIGKADYLCV
ncbi:MAG: toll/interleukin-1 receptor domain-containing protein, partial [Planctomycetaceae bacterium]